MYSSLVIKTPERRHSSRSGVFIANFEHLTPCSSVSIFDVEQVNVCWVNLQPLSAWCPLKGHTYLSKPAAEWCRFF